MSKYQRFVSLSKDQIIPISLGLLIALITGIVMLAFRVASWEAQLSTFEHRLGYRWSFPMEREAQREAERINPGYKAPDITRIRQEFIEFTGN